MEGEFRVEKQRIEAKLEFAGGVRIDGAFLCAPHSEHHVGRETIADLLNEPSRFFPFFPAGSDAPMLLNKSRLHVVRLRAPDVPGDPDRLADFSSPRAIVIKLEDGSLLEGTTQVAAPVGHTRTLDLLNESGRFIHLDCGEYHLVVNLDAVRSVEDAG